MPAPPPDDFDKDLDALFVHGGLTSDQAATRAVPASPTVARRVAELAAAAAVREQAQLQQVPVVSAKASYTRLSFIPPFVIAIPGVPPVPIAFFQNSFDTQASLVIPVSDYFLRYPDLIRGAKLAESSARVTEHYSEATAGEDARLSYYEWVRAKLQVLVAKRQLEQVKVTLDQVRALAEVQRLSRADLMRVESQEAEAEQVLDQLQQIEQLREEQLRLIIGAGENEPLAVGEDIRADIASPPGSPLDTLVDHAKQHRLDLRALDLGIVAKEEQRKAERARGYPELSAFGTAEDARPNPRFFPQTDVFKLTWLAGVEVTWQLPDTLNAEMNAKRIAAETDELRADRENLLRGTRLELLNAQNAVALAIKSLQTSAKGLAAAEEAFRVRKELLAAERATAVELVDSQTDLTRARITALNARVDLRVALAQLVHALGDDTK